MSLSTRTHRFLFAIAVMIWTWLLLKPNPVPEFIAHSVMDDVKYVMGKLLHFCAFAFLAWYGCFRRPASHWKWIWLACLVYAILSELGQHFGNEWFQTHRTGSVRDVLIDGAGIAVGALVSRTRERRISVAR